MIPRGCFSSEKVFGRRMFNLLLFETSRNCPENSCSQFHIMTALLLLRRPGLTPLSLGLGITATFATYSFTALRPLRCDASPTTRNVLNNFHTYPEEAKVPIFRNGRPNPAAYKQLSAGSVCGRPCCLSSQS